jgi:23S rRNA (guanine2445-N2)-methyltransferase / 23S rRNA (guanine2069-N7)-methyltransferase
VYDADLPDYSVAIDVYGGAGPDEGRRWVHIAEYAAPADIDVAKAAARLDDVLAIVPGVLGVVEDDVFLKVRERQRGTSQYGRVSRHGVTGRVAEGGLTFQVNFSDYLDTGLFLDHRLTRGMLREMAVEKRFLNLFAYTGSGTVYAAAGGATSTTTVDLSATYTEWAGRNMAANGFTGPRHELVQADVLTWLEGAIARGERYDLVFCDPPTFSNSKRMRDSWDVQRDHAQLIARIGRVLAAGGTLVFSCNRRKFVLDTAALAEAGLAVRDITASTIPRDFERTPGVHACWLVTHAGREGGRDRSSAGGPSAADGAGRSA